MKVQEVFTPNDTPTVTYVDRSEHKLEQRLQDHLDTPNLVVSLSGPSKSGKTVLIKQVIPEDLLIPVVGSGIESPEELWHRVLNWMGAPSSVTIGTSSDQSVGASSQAEGKLKLPLVAEGAASVGGSINKAWGNQTSEGFEQGGLGQVIKDIGSSEFVVFIDDFHYIPVSLQHEIGKQIKVAAENGVRVVTASVPHRADDVVRSNPELRGRVAAVDLAYWTVPELAEIARKGFAALDVELSSDVESRLAAEAFGSPQLMQSICLNLSYVLGIREPLGGRTRIDVKKGELDEALLRTSSFTDYSKMVTALHTGPRIRGTERKIHTFIDGTAGDVYRAILLAMKEDPASMSMTYDTIQARVRAGCVTEPPVGSSVTSALEQMDIIAEQVQPGVSPIAWDGDALAITDPYFLFFLRCSDKLSTIA